MLRRLKIDPEFQSKIPPLTFEELNLLETNILEEGRILSPLIVWNGSPTAMKRLSGFAKTSLAGGISNQNSLSMYWDSNMRQRNWQQTLTAIVSLQETKLGADKMSTPTNRNVLPRE